MLAFKREVYLRTDISTASHAIASHLLDQLLKPATEKQQIADS